jgi:hypothetical protein
MGGGSWSQDFYQQRSTTRQQTGQPVFAHHAAQAAKPRDQQTVHARLNPLGVKVRESCDSLEHPNSLAVGIILDVTGSMDLVPGIVQGKLPKLHGMIGKIGIPDTQILFGAVGDEFSDRGSAQFGQFESDNRMDEDLEHFWLEGNGGGNNGESYQNAIYFFARHTTIDCLIKRKKKGYLFIIGDEYTHKKVTKEAVKTLFGENMEVPSISAEDIIKECQQMYHIFYIMPQLTSHGRDTSIQNDWKRLLGSENVLILQNAEDICELIATTMGICEKVVTVDGAKAALEATGTTSAVSNKITSSLVELAKANGVDPGTPPKIQRL